MPIAEPILDTEDRIIPEVEETPTEEDYKYMSYETLSTLEGETDFEAYAAVLQGNPSKTLLKKFHSFLTSGNFHERDFVAYGEVGGIDINDCSRLGKGLYYFLKDSNLLLAAFLLS
jgi:hypothetical protein